MQQVAIHLGALQAFKNFCLFNNNEILCLCCLAACVQFRLVIGLKILRLHTFADKQYFYNF